MKVSTLAALATTITLSSAIPAPLPNSPPKPPKIVRPTTLSQYEVWTGAIHYQTDAGKIFKDGQTTDITTLATFDFPAASQGATCEFHFYLGRAATCTGSGLFDVFTSLAPAQEDTTSWPPGNQRDQFVARLSVAAAGSGEAAYVPGFSNAIQCFPCPVGTWALEFVGVYDEVDIEWAGAGLGAYFKYY